MVHPVSKLSFCLVCNISVLKGVGGLCCVPSDVKTRCKQEQVFFVEELAFLPSRAFQDYKLLEEGFHDSGFTAC